MNNQFFENKEILFSKKKSSKVLIAAHRGKFGGNIPENTIKAYEFALRSGADILEADVARTKDGALIFMHCPKVDDVTTGNGLISELIFDEIKKIRFISSIRETTCEEVNTLDEFLEYFKGRCLINLDRCWNYMDEVLDAVKSHGMVDQIILKNPKPFEKSLQWMESRSFEPIFMPIIKDFGELAKVTKAAEKAKIPAVELVFSEDDSMLIQQETIDTLHDKNIKVWVNSISLKNDLAGGHDDTVSVLGNPDAGWGWLLDHNVDILQTDWIIELKQYLEENGRR